MKKLLFCTQKVNKSQIRRENRNGVEHIILTSYTLPPNIVMNGGLYPTEEIDKSFESLNRTPVTIEHPEINGQYVSAADPETDMDFRFGAFNENATKMDDGRISLDKVINVQKALKVDKGKRLLDRINEVETSDSARPLHTSVGVFMDVEELENPLMEVNGVATNAEYGWIARNMMFDHDAILLDNIGAATPDQGTGIGINSESVKVMHFVVNDESRDVEALDLITNKDLSFEDIEQSIWSKLNQGLDECENYPQAIYDDYFIYRTKSGELFRSNYTIDQKGNLEIQDTRLPVERIVEYKPQNQPTEENAMRDTMLAELQDMGISVNADISDTALLAKYNKALIANAGEQDAQDDIPQTCLLYTSPSPRDGLLSRMPSSA